jgi:hypothetical protein
VSTGVVASGQGCSCEKRNSKSCDNLVEFHDDLKI